MKDRPLTRTKHAGIYSRGGTYVVRFRDAAGRSHKRSAPTIKAALALQAELRTDVRRGEYRPESAVTFAAYAEGWVETYEGRTANGLNEQGRDYNRRVIEQAVKFFGKRKLVDIDPPLCRQYVAKLRERGLAAGSVQRYTAVVRALFGTAYDDGLLRENPWGRVRVTALAPPVEKDDEPKALTEQELARVLSEVRCSRHQCAPVDCEECAKWQLLVEFFACTGLRAGEAFGLRWRDLDLGHKKLRVARVWNGRAYTTGKTRAARRVVPLSTDLCRRLWPLQGQPDQLVFAGAKGGPINRDHLARRVLQPAARRAAVEWVRGFHTLRHTAISRWAAAGWAPHQLQAAAGHTDLKLTYSVYVSVHGDGLGDADQLPALALPAPPQAGDTEQTA
jgi:integrase